MNCLFSYSGPVSFKIKKQLLQTVKRQSNLIATTPVLQKRVRYIFDEMVSNIYEYYQQHGFANEITKLDGYLQPDEYIEFVITSTVDKEDKEFLQNHLTLVNSLDETGLKNLYKKKLNEKETEKQNAGLGLISVRIKAGNPITYEFKKNKLLDIVILKIVVNLKNG